MRVLILAALVALASASERIVNGGYASPGDWPWQVSLRAPSSHHCGASILSTTKGVTAAHCVGEGSYTIRAGTVARSYCNDNCQDRTVTSVTRHPHFGIGDGVNPNDIATLRWNALTFNSEIGSIAMASAGLSGSDCHITGWGQTSSTSPNAEILREASTAIITNSECKDTWGSDAINDGHICVYNGATSACMGDSGGPLACKVSGQWRLFGATSWGDYTCYVGSPSVYTRISYFASWINAN